MRGWVVVRISSEGAEGGIRQWVDAIVWGIDTTRTWRGTGVFEPLGRAIERGYSAKPSQELAAAIYCNSSASGRDLLTPFAKGHRPWVARRRTWRAFPCSIRP